MATRGRKPKAAAAAGTNNGGTAKSYGHPEAQNVMRPDIGTQAQFKKKKQPHKFRERYANPILSARPLWFTVEVCRSMGLRCGRSGKG